MNRMREKLERLARAAVLAAVVIAPWLFGGADPWAYLLLCGLVAVGVTAWLVSLACADHVQLRAPLLALALVLLLAFLGVQMLPLPAPFVRSVSPLAAEAQATQRRVFEEIGAEDFLGGKAAGRDGLLTISASAAATRRAFCLLGAYIGAFLVLANTLNSWQRLRWAAGLVVASSFAMVIFALAQSQSGTRALYWFHEPRFGGAIFGPFTNRNHFAAHMNLALGITLALLLTAIWTREPRGRLRTWRQKIGWLSTSRANQIALLGAAALLLIAGVCASLSRGAIASLVASLCVVAAVLVVGRAAPKIGRTLAVVAILGLVAVRWVAWHPVVERLSTLATVAKNISLDARTLTTGDTLRVFDTSPAFGVGFGSFQHVFPTFQRTNMHGARWLHAHNDYAQLLAEGGAVGAVLVAAAALLFLRAVASRLPKVSRRTKLFVGGLAVGILAVALHSAVDYSLHKPANALLLMAVCAMALAAAQMSNKVPSSRLTSVAVRCGALVSLAAVVVAGLAWPSTLHGELAFARFHHLERAAEQAGEPAALSGVVGEAAAEADLVMAFARGNPDALSEVAAACLGWSHEPGLDPMARLRLAERAARASALAAQAAPSDYEPWLWLTRAQLALGLRHQARVCLTRASYLAPPGVKLDALEALRASPEGPAETDTAGGPAEHETGPPAAPAAEVGRPPLTFAAE